MKYKIYFTDEYNRNMFGSIAIENSSLNEVKEFARTNTPKNNIQVTHFEIYTVWENYTENHERFIIREKI